MYTITILSTDHPIHILGFNISQHGSISSYPNLSLPIVEFIGHDFMLNNNSTMMMIPKSFPWLVSQQLNVDHVHIAYPHATLLNQQQPKQSKHGMMTHYFQWSYHDDAISSSSYDFSSYTPSVIVLLLGKYDHDIPQYKDTLIQFIHKIRQYQSTPTPILILSEPLGDMIRSTQAAVYELNDQGDQSVFYLDTTNWLKYNKENNNDHQFIFAEKLAPMIQVKLAKPPLPLPGPSPNPALPDAWETMDVGNPGLHGSVSFDVGSAFTLWGSGRPDNDQTDAFRFVYQPLSGQGIIEATIQSHATFATCAKAGIMLREHLALGSSHLSIGISPEDGLFVRTREYNFNHTSLLKKKRAKPPYRLRLQRTLNEWIAQAKIITDNEHDDDDDDTTMTNWETIATIKDLMLARDIYVGLYVTSCDDTVVSVAKFTDVSVQGGVGRISFLLDSSTSPRFIDQSHP
ncbi:hypothetical protein BJ944DRAFT_154962 [Cunninghamella echinulata]|nr:hypothetical protein BJ944DRAFT_154962 [Cunninghamella echinulata]